MTEPTHQAGHLWARPGDRLIVRGHAVGRPDRDAEIIEALGEGDEPPFRVRWQDDGHVSQIFPGGDAYIEHFPPIATGDQEHGEP